MRSRCHPLNQEIEPGGQKNVRANVDGDVQRSLWCREAFDTMKVFRQRLYRVVYAPEARDIEADG